MSFSKEIKTLRQECLLSQEAFAKELGGKQGKQNQRTKLYVLLESTVKRIMLNFR